MRPTLFASCRWKGDSEPPDTIWSLIRHLYIDTDTTPCVEGHAFFRDLSALESIHVRAENVSTGLSHILSTTPNLHTLDLSRLCCKDEDDFSSVGLFYDPLPCLPPLPSRPSILKFCSHLDRTYADGDRARHMHATKIRGLQLPFAALVYDIGADRLEYLEVGAEALSLPFLAAYTWTSLRELVITGYWGRYPQEDPRALADPGLLTPATAHAHVHLGTILAAAPCLRALRVHCRFVLWLECSQCVVWPASEPPPPSGSAIPLLDTLELHNPNAEDDIYAQLPASLRTLSLLTWQHLLQKVDLVPTSDMNVEECLPQPSDPLVLRILTPAQLGRTLRAAALPELCELRFSYRGPADMDLFKLIATSFPRLELLEFHAELDPEKAWSARELAACSSILVPLIYLRVLRADVFRTVYADDHLEQYLRYCHTQERIDEVYANHECSVSERRGIPRRDVVDALFGAGEGFGDDEALDRASSHSIRFPALRQVWLSTTVAGGNRHARWTGRSWHMYHVDRDRDGRADLRLDREPNIRMTSRQVEDKN